MSVGRNDPCPCGSGKKYKKCCGAATLDVGPDAAERARTRLLKELVAFATGRQFDGEFRRAIDIYWEGTIEGRSLDRAVAAMEPDFARVAFIEWYVHDFRLKDGRMFIEHFLARRRAALDAWERAFLEQAQKTFVSLYLVLDVRLEEGLTLHDLLLDRPADVRERAATRSLVKWDIFAARLMERDGVLIMVGAAIPFRAQDREPLVLG
ncbi:MAG: SEC-C metal-binding domain-containing protein, partial [Armatimonadota bacterium]